MDTQNDDFGKGDSFKVLPFLVSMLDFWGVTYGWLERIFVCCLIGNIQ